MSEGQDIHDTMRRLAREYDDFPAMMNCYLELYPAHRVLYNIKDLLADAWETQAQARSKRKAGVQ